MKALRSFTVRPKLPAALAPLHELAMNLRWSWDARTRDLFRWVEPAVWDQTGHDPVRLLGLVGTERLETLVRIGGIYHEVLEAAEARKADLVVVGSHRPGMATYLIGSNATAIVRHATCSVLVIRRHFRSS